MVIIASTSAVMAFLGLCIYAYALWTDLDEAVVFSEICMIVAAALAVIGAITCPWLWILASLAGAFATSNWEAVAECISKKDELSEEKKKT